MKATNLYFEVMIRRNNVIKAFFLNIFFMIASVPRLCLEVFIRKSFGQRYFSFSTAMVVAFALAIMPYFFERWRALSIEGIWELIKAHWAWYLYIAAFCGFCWKRGQEIKNEPGVFDFAKYSRYNGDINPIFRRIEIMGITPTRRIISTWYEPLFFLLLAMFLGQFSIGLGYLFGVCSVIYGFSYGGAYYMGDQYLMDLIDTSICSEEMAGAFVEGKQPEHARGFEFIPKRPHSKEFRKEFLPNFFAKSPGSDVI